MSFAYVSKRRKTDEKASPSACSVKIENELFVWKEFDSRGLKNILGSHASTLSWSSDGSYLAVGTVKGLILVIHFPNKIEGVMVMKIKLLSSIPRCIEWSKDKCFHFSAHNGHSFKFKMSTQSISEEHVKNMDEFYTSAFWKENILFGKRHIYFISDNKMIRTFGPGENLTSCMIIANDTLFVAYDYSQNSSSDKSIIAFSLPSCAPVSNQLTGCLFSYSHLCYSSPYVYGLTSDGKITRFFAKSPYKPDKHFGMSIKVPYGFKVNFDIKRNLLAYGDESGKLVMKKISCSIENRIKNKSLHGSNVWDQIVLKDFCDSSDPIINVKFHPKLNYIAFSRWKGGFDIIPYNIF